MSLNKEQKRAIQKEWANKFSGIVNAGKVPLLMSISIKCEYCGTVKNRTRSNCHNCGAN